jgi:hypothetical protein
MILFFTLAAVIMPTLVLVGLVIFSVRTAVENRRERAQDADR